MSNAKTFYLHRRISTINSTSVLSFLTRSRLATVTIGTYWSLSIWEMRYMSLARFSLRNQEQADVVSDFSEVQLTEQHVLVNYNLRPLALQTFLITSNSNICPQMTFSYIQFILSQSIWSTLVILHCHMNTKLNSICPPVLLSLNIPNNCVHVTFKALHIMYRQHKYIQ